MVSSLNLIYIHLRLDELFGGDDWFGPRTCFLLEIFYNYNQLMGILFMKELHKSHLAAKLGCIASINIWKDTLTYEELTENVHQKEDSHYSTA